MSAGIKQRNLHGDWRLVGVFASNAAYLTGQNKTSASEGDTYYNTTLNQLRTYDGSSWSPAGQNGNSAGSLDDASIIGAKITSTQAIEIEASAATSNLFILDANGTTNVDIFDISSAGGTGDLINLTQSGTGQDIRGTSDLWKVSKAGLGVFDGGLTITADSKALTFGASSDLTMQFVDAAPGSVGSGLLIAGAAAAEQVQFGDSTYGVDVWFEGTADANYMLWDSSANELILEGVDIGLQNGDLINFGDSNDITMTYDGTDFLIDGAAADKAIKIGATNNQDIIVYGDTITDLVTFDTSAELVHFDGFDLQLKDSDILEFGDLSGGDVNITWDTTNLLIEAGAQDTGQIRIGSSNAIDFVIYDNAATGTITNDVSTSTIDVNGWDMRLQDDDYLLLGNSATAGADTDATLRWDATNSVLEIIGATQFEDNVTMDGDLTLSGTLTMSGALAPGSIALGDTEVLSFGDGTDYKISTAGSTAALIITAVNADDSINVGDGSVRTDFLIDNATTAGADVWFDASADTNNGAWYFGKDNDGVDVFFYGATASAAIQWDYSTDRLVIGDSGASVDFQDNTLLLFGTGSSNAGDFSISSDGSNLLIKEVASTGKGIEIGVDNKGLDVKFFGETGSVFMEWTQASDALIFDNADIEMGDGDIIVLGDGTDFSISATGTTVTTTLAAGSIWNISDTDDVASKVTFGVTGGTHGMDVTFNSISASEEMAFNAATKTFTLDNIDIILGDADSVEFGDGTDLKISATTATTTMLLAAASDLKISDTDDSGSIVTFGVTGGSHGLDVQFNTITSGEDIIFDAADKTLIFDNVDITLSDGDLIKFGDAGADGSIVSDGTNIDVTINASMTLGDGGTTDYASIAADGEITLAGTAKVTKNHQLPISTGGGTSTVSVITGAPSIDFNADAETAYATFQTPNDWDGASDLSIVMMVKNEIAETDGDDIEFVCTVKGISDGEAHTDAGQTVTLALNLTGGDEGQNVVNKCTGVIDWNDATHPVAAGDTVIIKAVVSLGAGTEPTGPLHIIDWWIEFTANKLGTAT